VPPEIQRLVDRGVVSMAHAMVLSDFGVSDLGEWVRQIGDNRVSVKQLRRDLGRALGARPTGRQKLYMKKERNRIRMYPVTISRGAPRDERRKVVALLQDAIEMLGSSRWRARSSQARPAARRLLRESGVCEARRPCTSKAAGPRGTPESERKLGVRIHDGHWTACPPVRSSQARSP
jgi:hypothetical protein